MFLLFGAMVVALASCGGGESTENSGSGDSTHTEAASH